MTSLRAHALTLLLVALVIAAGSCRSAGRAGTDPGPPRSRTPDYALIRESFDARLATLDRLWARTTNRFWYRDDQGRQRTEQLEGHLGFRAPDALFIDLTKLGELYLVAGSDARQSWWLVLGDVREASIAPAARPSPVQPDQPTLAIHAHDLVELVALRPLPAQAGHVAWSADGRHVVVTLPWGDGTRHLYLQPRSLRPERVELVDAAGQLFATAELSSYRNVTPRAGASGVSLPHRLLIELPGRDLRARITLYEPELSGRRPTDAQLDFHRWVQAYRVPVVHRLDGTEPLERAGGD